MTFSITEPSKDLANQQVVPTAWRSTIKQIVLHIVEKEASLIPFIPNVRFAEHISESDLLRNIEAYEATLIALPEASWETSLCMWYGKHWDVLVDLWTKEEGRSDLILQLRVYETQSDRFCYELGLIYVP